MSGNSRTRGTTSPDASNRLGNNNVSPDGMYVAQVVDNVDTTNTGRVTVKIGEFESDAEFSALMMTPMGGATNVGLNDDVSDPAGTAKSFGMWMQPPAPGTTVLVQFNPGMRNPVLMGGLITAPTNHNLGGNASAETKDGEIAPVAEQNPNDTSDPYSKPGNTERAETLNDQGLDQDYVRGHSMSSARRESPSKVMGITTPGGASITMDDGAADGAGSQNMRIKTPGGGQVLIDDSTGIVFITNQGGSTHIEMNAEGQIDIYSDNSFSIASGEDINFHAQGNINMQADQGINIQAGADGIKAATDGNIDTHSTGTTNIEATGSLSGKSSAQIKMTAPTINTNSGAAADSATKPTPNGLVENSGVTQSAAGRVPERHPWNGVPGVQEAFTTGEGKQQ
jgi:hypothetical protein